MQQLVRYCFQRREGPASARACRAERLPIATRAAFAEAEGRYAWPRVCGALTDAGEQTSEKMIARLMQ